jgi:uncharacterized protein YjbJ (UPF0337 family)
MNKDQIHGKWKEIKGDIQRAWGKITNDELDQAKGNATELAGLVQRKYGVAKDEASKKIDGIFEKYSSETDVNVKSDADKKDLI